MKKLSIAIAVALSTSTAFAADTTQSSSTTDMSQLSSTVDAPNNLYDFIDNDKLQGVAYAGAELGGNALIGDQEGDFEHTDMFKVGADFTYNYSENIAFLIGGEARYEWNGVDTLDATNYVDRFTFGVKTIAGTTTFGKQCGIADIYLGFADISQEHGLGADADEVACTSEQFNHHYFGENFDLGASYEHQNDAWAVGGSFTVANVVFGGTFVDTNKGTQTLSNNMTIDTEEMIYTVGAVAQFDKLNVALKYAFTDIEDIATNENLETEGYALGLAYNATTNFTISTTYNVEEYNDAATAYRSFDSDDWFTIGAAYRLNEHIELVTDLKVSSEESDQIFLRANVSL